MLSISISINSDSEIEKLVLVKFGIIIDFAIKGRSGTPAFKAETLLGNEILFLLFFKFSIWYPFKLNEIFNRSSDNLSTVQLGSSGLTDPRDTQSAAGKNCIIKKAKPSAFKIGFMYSPKKN